MIDYSFYCKICQERINPKKGLFLESRGENFVKSDVGVLIRMHHRHFHSDYSEQISQGYKEYVNSGTPHIIAIRKARSDARKKWQRDYKTDVERLK